MDYNKLAEEFMHKMFMLNKAKPKKDLNDSMQGEAFVLQYVFMHEGSVLPSELSNVMGISTARIAVTLNGLEQKGLVTRTIDASDRRRILVDITATGKEQAAARQKHMLEHAAKFLSLLGEEDAKEYVRITGKLAEMVLNKKLWSDDCK